MIHILFNTYAVLCLLNLNFSGPQFSCIKPLPLFSVLTHHPIWMWELDHKESWAPKNWCFWTVMLEKTLESPLDSKEIKPVNANRNQSWLFTGRTGAEAEAPILRPPGAERVAGRKARGLQVEEGGCTCQTFLSLWSSRKKQTSHMFFLLYTNLKGGFS